MSYYKQPPKDENDLLRADVATALWNLIYHEQELVKAQRILAYAKVILARADFGFTLQEAIEKDKQRQDDVDYPVDATEWLQSRMADAAGTVEHHECELTKAHAVIACLKGIVARLNFTDIDFAEIAKQQKTRLDE